MQCQAMCSAEGSQVDQGRGFCRTGSTTASVRRVPSPIVGYIGSFSIRPNRYLMWVFPDGHAGEYSERCSVDDRQRVGLLATTRSASVRDLRLG